MVTNEDLKRLAFAVAPFLVAASKNGNSMATVALDPVSLLGLPASSPGAGRVMIAIAAGSSKEVLTQAIAHVQNPQ